MNPRPTTLKEIAERSDSMEEFGRHFQDWLHEARALSARPRWLAAILAKPPKLHRRFPDGAVADAWLAAYAETVAQKIGAPVPSWAKKITSPEPWFAVSEDPAERLVALRDSPAPFKNRNLFTPSVDLPLRLSRGRPAESAEHKREKNRLRQQRFRTKQQRELLQLRRAARRTK